MTPRYSFISRNLFVCFFLLALCPFTKVKATDLNAGDLMFTGYHANASTTDAFSFVVLVNLSGTTTVNFTDNGWLSTNVLQSTEQTVTWNYSGTLVAGREITISGPSGAGGATAVLYGSGTSIGTCTGLMPSFATSGDQVIAYRGTAGAPTIIAGLHMNVYSTDLMQCANTTNSAWDPPCITANANFSVMPLGLTGGVNATWIGTVGVGASEQDNARFNCTGTLLNAAQVRAAVGNSANWQASSVAPPTFTLPSTCGFLGLALPVTLISFNGHTSNNEIKLSWQTVNEHNHSHFEVEKSTDGQTFAAVTNVAGQGGFSYLPFDYSFVDRNPAVGANYYRLKSVSTNGEYKYSKTIRVIYGQKVNHVLVSPNPARTDITITMPSNVYSHLVVRNIVGMVVKQDRITTNNHRIDISGWSTGHYTIELIGTTSKQTEQLLIVR